MKVALFGQFYHKNSESSIQTLLDILASKFIDVHVENNFLIKIDDEKSIHFKAGDFKTFDKLDASFDLLISVGGDGTMLRAITYVHDLEIPIVGINMASLGLSPFSAVSIDIAFIEPIAAPSIQTLAAASLMSSIHQSKT